MNFHLLATQTLSKQTVRHGDLKTPEIIKSGRFDECYVAACNIVGSSAAADVDLVMRGHPIAITEFWTYWVITENRK